MQKRHFELIAQILQELGGQGSLGFQDARGRLEIARAFADALEHTNLNFKRDRFIEAATLNGDGDNE